MNSLHLHSSNGGSCREGQSETPGAVLYSHSRSQSSGSSSSRFTVVNESWRASMGGPVQVSQQRTRPGRERAGGPIDDLAPPGHRHIHSVATRNLTSFFSYAVLFRGGAASSICPDMCHEDVTGRRLRSETERRGLELLASRTAGIVEKRAKWPDRAPCGIQ